MEEALQEGRVAKQQLEAAKAENDRLQQEYFVSGDARRRELRARESELRNALQKAQTANANRAAVLKSIETAPVKLAEIEKWLEYNAKSVARIKAELGAVTQFSAKRAELLAAELGKGLTRASIQLFDIVKTTGEMKPVFRLLYDNKPFGVLSTSERVRLGLEISGLVKRLIGIEYPCSLTTPRASPISALPRAAVRVPGSEGTRADSNE